MHAQFFIDTRQGDVEANKYLEKILNLKDMCLLDKVFVYDAREDAPMFNEMEIVRTPTCIVITDKGHEMWLPPRLEQEGVHTIADYIISYNEMDKADSEYVEKHPECNETVDSPSYYKQASVEAIELMKDLMNHEQFEGFLWGNIIKYAYRYGKKGSSTETAAKIRQYAEWLEEEAMD